MMMSSIRGSSNGNGNGNGNGNRNRNVQYHHCRGHSFNGIPDHLFSNNTRRTLSFASSPNDVVSRKLGTLFAESEKLPTSGFDDLLSSSDGGKHDYDWLLTPPRSPDFQPPHSEPQPISAPSGSSLGKPTSNVNASRSRLSASEISENRNDKCRAGRNSSATGSASNSLSTCQNKGSYSSNRAYSSTLLLNTSCASVPSSPITITRSLLSAAAARPSTSTSRLPTISSADKARPSQIPKPSVSSYSSSFRPYIPVQSPPAATARSISRPCTPTRRHSTPSLSTSAGGLGALLSKCNSAPRSSTPGRRRPQPVVPPDFPLETPPNLRTTLPDRPVSAGRSRPAPAGAATLKASSSEAEASARRQSSPIVNRGRRLLESTAKSPGRVPHAPSEVVAVARRSHIMASSSTATDGNGLGTGRSISKKSLDMTTRHMVPSSSSGSTQDIRSSCSGSLRSLSSATVFPRSIRTSAPKNNSKTQTQTQTQTQPRGLNLRSAPASVDVNGRENINERQHSYLAKLIEVDMHDYESSRYCALLLKNEDLKNSDWLHSANDDKCHHGPIFDNGYESLPEPFGIS